MALVSQSELEARLGRSLTAEEVSAFSLLNSAIQTEIEKIIGSSVEEEQEATRYYDGGLQHLKIDPCIDITAVKQYDEDQSVIYTYDTSDYTKEPVNHTLKTMIRYRHGKFYQGMNIIGVTAKFSIYGDLDTRIIIKDAIISSLASEIDNSGNILKESIEGYSVEFATTETKNALSRIRLLFPEVI